jgi:hypothetical protein
VGRREEDVATYADGMEGRPRSNSDFSSWDVGSGSAKVDSRRKERVVFWMLI